VCGVWRKPRISDQRWFIVCKPSDNCECLSAGARASAEAEAGITTYDDRAVRRMTSSN
jgi:hypothetical protein